MYEHTPSWSSGLTRHPVTVENTGSNPVGGAESKEKEVSLAANLSVIEVSERVKVATK